MENTVQKRKFADLQFGFTVKGKGEPVLMLHGWGGEMSSWEALSKELESHFQLVAVDLPGFGISETPASPWTLDDYVDFVEKFAEMVGKSLGWPEKFNLIVHSFGGRIAIKMAQRKNRIKKAVFISAAGIKHPLSLRAKIGYLIGATGKTVLNLPGIRILQKPARKMLYRFLGVHDFEKTEGTMKKTFQNVIAEDLKDQIPKITFPVCIIWGTEDSYVPVSDAYLMKKEIPDSELHIINGGRHGIHKTHPKELAGWIKTFLKRDE